MKKPRLAGSILRSAPHLKGVRTALEKQRQLVEQVRSLLPEPLAQHCLWAQLKNSQLIIHTESPAWASRLRYYSRDLNLKLQDQSLPVKKISVRIHPVSQRGTKTPRRANPLSPDNARMIHSFAEDIEDPNLRAALLRLSKHGR